MRIEIEITEEKTREIERIEKTEEDKTVIDQQIPIYHSNIIHFYQLQATLFFNLLIIFSKVKNHIEKSFL